MAEYTFHGEYAEQVMDMIWAIARFASGPGLHGFCAWLDRDLAEQIAACECGKKHPVVLTKPEKVRKNLARLAEIIDRVPEVGRCPVCWGPIEIPEVA